MKLRGNQHKPARIEMLPLIDIVFLLLVFFIYAMLSMAVHHGLDLKLPGSASVEQDSRQTLQVMVQSGSHGVLVSVNGEVVAIGQLRERLVALAGDNKEQPVQIFASDELSYQQLFRVLDAVQGAGLRSVGLMARPEAGS